ncbi:cytochrome P450 [Nonomuraea longispora]|uniref:Cytochrome P450 n=1 Tax=Nonomuraea longispora TaxID=1848320 RepID=A0A4R4NFY8_9ACTN|nr:cytochrome P450 [Nonomuraea longispora]TDC08148.1 cytochrome P450 [Nonomuraea longispora]
MQSSPLRFPFAWPRAAEPPVELATLREEPVVRVTLPSGDEAFLVTRYEDIRRVLSDPRVSRNRDRPGAPRMTEQKTKVFQNPRIDRDPPEHTRMRRLMAKAFTATRVEALRPHVRQVAEELVTDLLKQSPPVDLHEAFAVPLTLQVICGLLGVPPQDQARFRGSLGGAWQYMGELIEGKRRDPGDDLISALIGVRDEDDGRLSAHELHVWCVILLLAGFETTATQLGSGTVLLLTHPDQLERLREDPGLIPDAVEELLRCQIAGHSLSMLRYVTDDIEVGGVTIPRGSGLIPILESANLDESVFPDPMRLDITRKNNQHLVFSAGPHFCMGAALARLELQVALEALIREVPTLRLAVPPSALRHHDSPLDLGLRELPVAW